MGDPTRRGHGLLREGRRTSPDILQAIQAVRRKEAVAAVAMVPFETAANGSTNPSSLAIRPADRKNIAVPLTSSASWGRPNHRRVCPRC